MITVALATGREHVFPDATAWEAAGDVLTVFRGGQPLASFRNWLTVESDEPAGPGHLDDERPAKPARRLETK